MDNTSNQQHGATSTEKTAFGDPTGATLDDPVYPELRALFRIPDHNLLSGIVVRRTLVTEEIPQATHVFHEPF
jgi:hypothetical protein